MRGKIAKKMEGVDASIDENVILLWPQIICPYLVKAIINLVCSTIYYVYIK